MTRLILIFLAAGMLAGCDDIDIIVEDNSPDKLERENLLEFCAGTFRIDWNVDVDPAKRLACIETIYGN